MSRTYGITTCIDCGEPFVRKSPGHKHCGCKNRDELVDVLCHCGCETVIRRKKWLLDRDNGKAFVNKVHRRYWCKYKEAYPVDKPPTEVLEVPCACGCGVTVKRKRWQLARSNGKAFVHRRHLDHLRRYAEPYPYSTQGSDKVEVPCACGCGTVVVTTYASFRKRVRGCFLNDNHRLYWNRNGEPYPVDGPPNYKVTVKCSCGCGTKLERTRSRLKGTKGVAYKDKSHRAYHVRTGEAYPEEGSKHKEILTIKCACGCGILVRRERWRVTNPDRVFLNKRHYAYHYRHGKPFPVTEDTGEELKVPCACGCGILVKRERWRLNLHNGNVYATDACRNRSRNTQLQEMKQKAAMFDLLQANMKGEPPCSE